MGKPYDREFKLQTVRMIQDEGNPRFGGVREIGFLPPDERQIPVNDRFHPFNHDDPAFYFADHAPLRAFVHRSRFEASLWASVAMIRGGHIDLVILGGMA